MKSKYSALEIEQLLDKMAVSLDKSIVVATPLTSLDDVDGFKLLSANVTLKVLRDIESFAFFDKASLTQYLNSQLPGYSLMSSDDKDNIRANSSILPPASTIANIKTDATPGSMGMVVSDDAGKVGLYVIDSDSKPKMVNGNTKRRVSVVANSQHQTTLNHIQPMEWIEVKIVAMSAEAGMQLVEVNVVQALDKWVIQITQDSRQNTTLISNVINIELVSDVVVKSAGITEAPILKFTASRDCSLISTTYKTV